MQSNSARYSGAGDAFHFRWAARRCLRMIDPRSRLDCVMVEASKDRGLPGELAIDLAEYSDTDGEAPTVDYYQLKHSRVRTRVPLGLGELRRTLGDFARRFRSHEAAGADAPRRVSFSIVTNRLVHAGLRDVVRKIAEGEAGAARERRALEGATGMRGGELGRFCAVLHFVDGEGDYRVQKRTLHGEMGQYLVGFVDAADVNHLIALVEDRALPDSEDGVQDGRITLEDVLWRLGGARPGQMFPALPVFDRVEHAIEREQQAALRRHILADAGPTIVLAEGGVGKTVVAQLAVATLPAGSRAVLYDCFGAGGYRRSSEPRHEAAVALVQMANELAAQGLCSPLIARPGQRPVDYFRDFGERLSTAAANLRALEPGALLVLMIDAADNAEMAAAERGERCFAGELLRERLPEGCRLVMYCRPEREHLLVPPAGCRRFVLEPFSAAESLAHLRTKFPAATEHDGGEFFRLSGGNPRVQAGAMNGGHASLEAMLASLGPGGMTVDDQIEGQLEAAIDRVKESHAVGFEGHVEDICRGLANLPPLIPIAVLAKAAGVSVGSVRSLVSDLGRPLWCADDAVQFRDEPTETWFQKRFADDSAIARYVDVLESLAAEYTYVARALPQLLLKSGNYKRLIALALSDRHLPTNPIDERDVRVYRLQFAFKAALKGGSMADAARIAFRAGEETAGTRRQAALLGKNLDLAAALHDAERVQEIARRQVVKGDWPGSDILYSAALLAAVPASKGDARSYLRAARRAIRTFYESLRKGKGRPHERRYGLPDSDVVELAWAHYHLSGAGGLVEAIQKWGSPGEFIFKIVRFLARRLVDAGRFAEVEELLKAGADDMHIVLAIVDELMAVARRPPKKFLAATLEALGTARRRPKRPAGTSAGQPMAEAILSFLEACTGRGMPREKIRRILDYYMPRVANAGMDGDHPDGGRGTFLRGVALRAVLVGQVAPEVESLLPKLKKKERDARPSRDLGGLRTKLRALLPWHFLRATLVVRGARARVDPAAAEAISRSELSSHYERFDRLPEEVAMARFEVLAWKTNATVAELDAFASDVVRGREVQISLYAKSTALRVVVRTPHLARLREPLEISCQEVLRRSHTDTPEERADGNMMLARAMLAGDEAEARAYFAEAIDAVSKFGDEMLDRWNAVGATARRAAEAGEVPQSLVHLYMRCAEMIGDAVVREKHWNRNEVFRIGARLDPAFALAALSRWREREVGYFPDQMHALTACLVEEGAISPAAGYALTAFFDNSVWVICCCLKKEENRETREGLFDRAITSLELVGIDKHDWRELRAAAVELRLPLGRLDGIIGTAPKSRYYEAPVERRRPGLAAKPVRRATPAMYFKGVDLLSAEAVRGVLRAIGEEDPPRYMEAWAEMVELVPAGRECEFLRLLVREESLDLFDFARALGGIRPRWMHKISVRREWPAFLRDIGRRFAAELLNSHRWKYWQEEKGFTAEEVEQLRAGVLERITDSADLFDAETLFGFAAQTAVELAPEEAVEVLEFALRRFEGHMALELGDGPWAPELEVSRDVVSATAGLVWAALASPEAETRWRAAHCARRLVEWGCDAEMDALLVWMRKGASDGFGVREFPFYRLHGELYLLIALARGAEDRPEGVRRHADYFAELALGDREHLLIQEFAARIARAIEGAFPGCYAASTVEKLARVGLSPFTIKEVSGDETFDSPAHAAGSVDKSLKFGFGMDFEQYWLGPLGDVFGVPQTQVAELVSEVIARDFGVVTAGRYPEDARRSIWNHHHERRTFSGDRSSYGKTDDLQFYYSYHAMWCVAASLRRSMPVLRRIDRMFGEEGDRWDDWLGEHLLTRADGRWLSDRRDPYPTLRRSWIGGPVDSDFQWSITGDDFYDAIHRQCPLPGALCVEGFWADCDRQYSVENIHVASALVDPEAASALASSLRDCVNRFDVRFPAYREKSDDEEYARPPFLLEGWLTLKETPGDRIDSFDPQARKIIHPPIGIGARFASVLGLASDPEGREWRRDGKVVAICDVWSERPDESPRGRSPHRQGRRLCVTVDVLQELCVATGKLVVFSVALARPRESDYGSRGSDFPYVPGCHKIFIFSANGRLQDTRKSHRPR